ncbi:hypothetical protein NP233_g8054 [Leucocoprinus birnbaumii]|uniref:Peptidase M20 dimerisation domain-containing protein n=1 Tax=Leucocoprinus birnbaumii TaxID=56174 RepID=A0AAD5VN15_9AGAR|nr:hypothetical protein NP233_g8054 [Leucocoprinus birnbaumii]
MYAWTEQQQLQISSNLCAQPSPPNERSKYSEVYDTPEFKEISARRLAGAVKIPTMTFDDMGPPLEDSRWAPFVEMHQYLKKTFPLVHKSMEKNIVGGYSLIYKQGGSRPELKPLLLTGHLDVVPAVTALERWTFPPFEGRIEGGWVHGRGSADCKNNVIGILSAMERMLEVGWKPERTILFAFGQDEEISGPRGAFSIAQFLGDHYGHDGIAMIVDEGGMGLSQLYGTEFALPGIAEKGYVNAVITVEMAGGHSSIPTRHTSIGILSKIISTIEDSEAFQPKISTESPIWGYLSCIAAHGDRARIPNWIRKAVSAPSPDFPEVAEKFAATASDNRYLIQTSKAATVIHGGLKVNALAEAATVNFNSRIEIFSSVSEVSQTYVELAKPIAEKYSLRLQGKTYSNSPTIGNITFEWNDPHNPSPISPAKAGNIAWDVFSQAVQAAFGRGVIAAPSAMTGNTDTRHYWNLTRNIYRWSPARVGTRLNIHTVDEKIKIDTHVDAIRFYTELMLAVDRAPETF